MSMELLPAQVILGRSRVTDNTVIGAADWGRFQASVITFMAQEKNGEFYRVVLGTGIGMDDRIEENATVLGSVYSDRLPRLRNELSLLKHMYDQHAILLIVGELEVIT